LQHALHHLQLRPLFADFDNRLISLSLSLNDSHKKSTRLGLSRSLTLRSNLYL
jgi:hypothetical protein